MIRTSRHGSTSVPRFPASLAVLSLLAGAAMAAPLYRTDGLPGNINWFSGDNWYNEATGLSGLAPSPDDDAFIGATAYLTPAIVDIAANGAVAFSLTLGNDTGASGTLNLRPGGSLSVTTFLTVGNGGTGTFNQSGGSLQAARTGVGFADSVDPGLSGIGSFDQTGGTHTLSPDVPGGASSLVVGAGTGGTGAYSLSGADALLQAPSTVVGFLGGNGAFTHTAGTHLITSDSPGAAATVGIDFPGLFLGFGLANDPYDPEESWIGYPSKGSYSLTGGTLTITRAPALPELGAPIGAVVWLGTAGTGTLLLGDENGTGTLEETDPPGDDVGVSLLLRPIPYAEGGNSATVRGWGTVGLTGVLLNNGRVIADGYGQDRDLDLTSFSLVASQAGADEVYYPLRQSDETQAGWYAQNHGRLLLPTTYTEATETGWEVLWGTGPVYPGGNEGAPVNSLRILLDGLLEEPSVSIALLAPDHGAVPAGTTGYILGIWDISLLGGLPDGVSADLIIRYDDVLADGYWEFYGLEESALQVYHFRGQGWEPLPTKSVDTESHFIICSESSGFSPFALGWNITNQPAAVPEPATLTLLALGGLTLLRRRRRKP